MTSTRPSDRFGEPERREGGGATDPVANDNIADLVQRTQAGDELAFAALYSHYFDRVYGYLRVILRDPHEAEDTVQQVFIKALEAIGTYEDRPGKGFAAWLFRIARNEALMHLRKHSRVSPEDPERLDQRRDTSTSLAMRGWPSDRDLARWLERLPEAQRQTLTLRYMFEMTTDEIGEILDRTPEAIRKLQHRALRTLEERLGSASPSLRPVPHRPRRSPMLVRIRRVPVLRARRFSLQSSAHPLPKPTGAYDGSWH